MKEKIINLKNKLVSLIMANKILSISICVALLIIIIVVIVMCTRTEIGNTNGNLNNLGFSVKKNGWVYYNMNSDQSDTNGIYKMKNNGDKKERISTDYALYLNNSGSYLYYIASNEELNGYNLIKIKTNGEDREVIAENVVPDKVTVIDNWIYYFDASNFCRIKTNKKDKQILTDKSIENYEIDGNWIYYSYMNDGKYVISKMKTNGEDNTRIDQDAGKVFFIKGNTLYYIYENYNMENYEYKYELYKMKTNGKYKEKVADLSSQIYVDTINFSDNKIYYTKTEDDGSLGIYSIKLNGEEETKITDVNGYSTSINIIDNWLYYPDQNENGGAQMLRVNTNGENKQSL